MKSLHIVKKNPIKNIEDVFIPPSKFEVAYAHLSSYLERVKETKDEIAFKDHEAAVTRLVYTLGQAALSEILSHYDANCEAISVGKQTYRRKHQAPKEYQTALGPVKVERHVYANRKKDGDGQGICPLELQTGIIEGYWTPMAAKNAMWVLAHLTPLDGVMIGMKPEQPMEQTEAGAKLSENRDESPPSDVESSNSSGIASKKSMKTEWREASCGTISFFDAEGERISTIQYGQMPEHKKATLKTLLLKNTESILQKRPELKLIHLADGAQDNWTFFDEEMPFGFQLTDFYHASEYLKDAFDAAYPKNSDKAKAKFEEYKIILRDEVGGINKVLRALRHLRTQYKGNKVIEASVTYFTNNQHRMHYAEAKNRNYPIGSGIVEAACKTLVGQRLKRAGMSWKNYGGQGVLTFRSLIKSSRFEKAWNFIEKQYKQKVVEHKNVIYLAAQNMS